MFDPDYGKTGFARDLFRLRHRKLGICQESFAERYGVSLAMMKDQEQARHNPHPAFRVLVAAIDLDPFFMAKAAQAAEERWGKL
jgi:DNA-binding transcriptional regulator YiaG